MTVAEALPDTMLIGDLQFEVTESPRRATVGITVDRDGSLQLHAPAGCPADALATWAHSKRMWVYRKLAEKDLLIGDSDRVRMERGRIVLPRTGAGQARTALIGWYRDRGRQWLPGRLRPWADRMDLHPSALDVRDLGYRWGSLGSQGRLNIHWATLQLPPSLVDYVLVHELAHIAHPQHTPAFWATVERALPDYERRKQDLLVAGAGLWLG